MYLFKKNTQITVILILSFLMGLSSLKAQLSNCNTVGRIGTALSTYILAEINGKVAGSEYKISRLKRLKIKNVSAISFDGCKVRLTAQVTLKRKARRDARGRVEILANVTQFNARQICISNARVDKVRLSNTLRVGEGFYKWVANKVIPKNSCFNRR